MHTEKSKLNPLQIGEAKVKIEIRLKAKLPETIMVKDNRGNTVKIGATYPRTPPRCSHCDEFGHVLAFCSSAPPADKANQPPRLSSKDKGKSIAMSAECSDSDTVKLAANVPLAPSPIQPSGIIPLNATTALGNATNKKEVLSSLFGDQSSSKESTSAKSNDSDSLSCCSVANDGSQSEATSPSIVSASDLAKDFVSDDPKELSPSARKKARKKKRRALLEASLALSSEEHLVSDIPHDFSVQLKGTSKKGRLQAF